MHRINEDARTVAAMEIGTGGALPWQQRCHARATDAEIALQEGAGEALCFVGHARKSANPMRPANKYQSSETYVIRRKSRWGDLSPHNVRALSFRGDDKKGAVKKES